MRIVYVSLYPPVRDGIGDYTAALADAVRDDGHEVRVVTPRPLDGAPPEVLGALPRSRRGLAALLAEIDAWDPDAVHVQFAVATFGTRIPALARLMAALRTRRATVVITLHEVTRDIGSLRAAGRAVYRRLAGLADRVVVHTEQSRAALTGPVGAAVDPLVVAHPQRDLPPATATASELRARHGLGQHDVLLAFGFIHVDKGLDDLVEALVRLGSRDVRLAVAGTVRRRQGVFRAFELRDRAHLRRVRRLIGRCGLEDRVVFAGYVPDGEVRAWFELADAAVLPYRRIEQSGVANLAAAAGTPVLASEVGGITEIGDPRWRFPARDPERLARVLDDFLAWRRSRRRPSPSMPELSVVICSLNGARGVDRLLRALAGQTIAGALEVVVVDDGSTDDTSAVARSHGAVVIRHEVNRGLAAARNTGVDAARAPIVAFLDDDCRPMPDWAERLLSGYDDGAIGVGSVVVPTSGPGLLGRYLERHNPLSPLEIDLGRSESLPYRFLLYLRRGWAAPVPRGRRPVYSLVGAGMSFRRDALLDVGLFDTRFTFGAEELDLCRRLAAAHPRRLLVLEPGARVVHEFEPSLRDMLRRSRAYGRGSARMYRKWPGVRPTFFPLPVAMVALLALGLAQPPALLAALAAPHLVAPRGLREAVADGEPARVLDAYLQLARETWEDVGFLEGLWAFRDLEPESP